MAGRPLHVCVPMCRRPRGLGPPTPWRERASSKACTWMLGDLCLTPLSLCVSWDFLVVETWAFCPRAFVALWSLQLTPHARFHPWPVPWAIVNVSLGPGEAPFSAGPCVGPGDPECMTGSRGDEMERYEGKEKEVHCEASPPWPQAVPGSRVPKSRHLVPAPKWQRAVCGWRRDRTLEKAAVELKAVRGHRMPEGVAVARGAEVRHTDGSQKKHP